MSNTTHCGDFSYKYQQQQECIPVGCVPPAAVGVPGRSPPGAPPRPGTTPPLGLGTPPNPPPREQTPQDQAPPPYGQNHRHL